MAPTGSTAPLDFSASSLPTNAPIAQASLTRDELDDSDDAETEPLPILRHAKSHDASAGYTMSTSFRRPSFVAASFSRAAVIPSQAVDHPYLTEEELAAVRQDERSLLRDNAIIPPKHPQNAKSSGRGLVNHFKTMLGRIRSNEDVEAGAEPGQASEQTPLLQDRQGDPSLPYGGQDSPENIDKQWDEAVAAGKIHTTWQRETKMLARYSRSLVLTFVLQFSLPVVSVFTVGHLGKIELGAVSLGSMTANITGYAVYQGLATSLDTLASQAYGAGKKKLVGLQMQRMIFFLWTCTIPIAIVWLAGGRILAVIVPEKECAELAGLYLRVIILGAPAYAAFEGGKRFVQAQGLFQMTLYVLLIVAPLNVFLHWLFVWQFKWGFVGAPIAVTITENLMPLLLFLFVRTSSARECWGGFSKQAFRNWWPMIRLALPGLVMVLAEFMAFEILSLSASWISSTHLAAQSLLSSITALTYQLPFPISIAASTRIANLIGATLAPAAKTAAKVAVVTAVFIGILNMVILSSARNIVPRWFTNDEDVIKIVSDLLPLCAAFQLFDALAAVFNGILRGIGKQEVGGLIAIFAYYAVGLPISFSTGFGLDWKLYGLWAGPAIALFVVSIIEGIFISRTSWEKAVEDAKRRNVAG